MKVNFHCIFISFDYLNCLFKKTIRVIFKSRKLCIWGELFPLIWVLLYFKMLFSLHCWLRFLSLSLCLSPPQYPSCTFLALGCESVRYFSSDEAFTLQKVWHEAWELHAGLPFLVVFFLSSGKCSPGGGGGGDAAFVCATSRDLVRHELNASSAYPRFCALLLQRHPSVGKAEGAV